MSSSGQPSRTYASAVSRGGRGAAAPPPTPHPAPTHMLPKKTGQPGRRIGDMQLRGNLIAQPGAPDMPAPKRTTDEVQQEKTAKAAQKQQIVADRDRAVTSAAAIGHRISEQDASRKAHAHRPAEVPVTRVSRKRPETKSVVGAPSDPGPSTATAAKPGLRQMLARDSKTETAARQANRSPPVIDEFEGNATDDEYQPPPEAIAVDEPSEDDVMDASDEDVRPKKGKRQPKPKISVRTQVEAKRAELAAVGRKRAGSVAGLSPATVSTKVMRLDFAALRKTHQRGRSGTPTTASSVRGRSSSSGVTSLTGGSRGRSVSSGADGYERDEDGNGFGGIDSDPDDTGEREAAQTSTTGGKAARRNTTFATVVETVVPGVVVPSARHIPAAQRGACARRRTNHTLETLPAPIREALTKDVFPHAIESHFSQNDNPWNEISQQQVFELYTEVTTQEHAGEEDAPVQKTMHHQVVQKFHAFRNKMASAAVEVGAVLINALADKHDLTRSQVVDDLLEIVDPEMEISQFCFREVEFDADGGCYPRGLFQSEGVLYVFAVFCTFTKRYGALGPIFFKPNDRSTWPRAALVLAVQALKRVLNYSRSGNLVLTKSSTTDFSKANWDDHYEYPEGVRTAVASTSSIAAAVEQLTEAHWERIIKAAQVIAGSSSNTADRQEEDVRAISQMWRQGRQLFVRDYDDDDGMGDDNADKTMVDEDAEQLMPPGEASADVNPHSSSPSPVQGS
ncbi:hypothetical protein C8F01DRAFT_1294228 [Mycena amicta]|nr:hypothetical protein C8F01DRAFT_1294228 [Mycena amicta]